MFSMQSRHPHLGDPVPGGQLVHKAVASAVQQNAAHASELLRSQDLQEKSRLYVDCVGHSAAL